MTTRELTYDEQILLEFLISKANGTIKIPKQTRSMLDGKMGSITFDIDGKKVRNADLIEAHYVDSDEKLVVITLTLNQEGELFELDFWKTDFSELRSYPKPEQLKIINGH